MLQKFCISQNIRSLIDNLPSDLQDVADFFVRTFESDNRGTLGSEVGNYFEQVISFPNTTKTSLLSAELFRLLVNHADGAVPLHRALMQPYFDHRRARYAAQNHSELDSYIIFGDYTSGNWSAGQITDIIALRCISESSQTLELVIAIREFYRLAPADAAHDFYAAQGHAIGCLFYNRLANDKKLIEVKDLVCHFVKNPIIRVPGINADCVHVLPVFRVSNPIIAFVSTLTIGRVSGINTGRASF